jgi:signal transduction histidine kinase
MPSNRPTRSAGFPHAVPGIHGGTGGQFGCYGDAMRPGMRQRLAFGAVLACLVAGLSAQALWSRVEAGLRLGEGLDGRVEVVHVDPLGLGASYGIGEGMLVQYVNGVELIDLPDWIVPEDWDGLSPLPAEFEPEAPVFAEFSELALDGLLSQPIRELALISRDQVERGSIVDGYEVQFTSFETSWLTGEATRALLYGLGLMGLGVWLLASGRAGGPLRPMAVPLALAIAAPLLLQPLAATYSGIAYAVRGVLLAAAMVPLALELLVLIEDPRDRRLAELSVAAVATLAVGTAVATLFNPVDSRLPDIAHWVLLGAIPLIPGLWAAGPPRATAASASSSGRLLRASEYALAGATPLFALASATDTLLVPLSLWLLVVFVSTRLSVRPLARLATRVQLQRDLVVAATEAERARVAADIHDDALQELTLLVRRLDAAGDTEGAEIARNVADRLRAICGDLRLPILDDLGVGPALDWLVVRIERLAGGEVRLERNDGTRPPADVELAFFRVAQEALANAVKHGRPPIVVRYQTTPSGASLSVDDAGPGIASEAGAAAEQAGRFGLLNMAQRAEQIGAILDVRAWPGGGTHVALEWRPG